MAAREPILTPRKFDPPVMVSGLRLPTSAEIEFLYPSRNLVVVLTIGLVGDEYVLQHFSVGQFPFNEDGPMPVITKSFLAKFDADEMRVEAARYAALMFAREDDAPNVSQRAADTFQRTRRYANTPDHLQRVADVFNGADERPVETVREHFNTSYRNAARWVSLARDAGMIPPVRRAGGK